MPTLPHEKYCLSATVDLLTRLPPEDVLLLLRHKKTCFPHSPKTVTKTGSL